MQAIEYEFILIEKVRLVVCVGYSHSRIVCEKSEFERSWKSSFGVADRGFRHAAFSHSELPH